MYDSVLEKSLIKYLIYITIGIVVLNIINVFLGEPSWQVTRFIHVGLEANLPTWFSSIILAMAALYAFECSINIKANQKEKKLWQIMSLGLIGMSCDEVAMIHESIGNIFNKYIFKLDAIKHSPWVFILGPIVLIFIVMFIYKINKYLNRSIKAIKIILMGIIVYVTGAFILEATINYLNHDSLEWLWKIENIIEESFEMFGVILIIRGLMTYVHSYNTLDFKGYPLREQPKS